MSRIARQFFCEKHGPYILYVTEEGTYSTSGWSGAGHPDARCPKCRFESTNKKLAIIFAIILFLLVGLPKIIYGKFGKKGVIIYFACWLGVVISLVAVKKYNDYQVQTAREKGRAEQESKRKKIEETWSAITDSEYNWNEAVKYCSSQGWRLPTNDDWEALKKFIKGDIYLFAPNGECSYGCGSWWSATATKNDDKYAYTWNIRDELSSSWSGKKNKQHVRCIKEGSAKTAEKIVDIDEKSKQIKATQEARIAAKWKKIEEGWSATSEKEYNWSEAVKYCSNKGWRLPTDKDIEALEKFLIGDSELYDKFAIPGGGSWWTAKKDNQDGYAYTLTITNSGFYPDSRPEYETFYVRCIKK